MRCLFIKVAHNLFHSSFLWYLSATNFLPIKAWYPFQGIPIGSWEQFEKHQVQLLEWSLKIHLHLYFPVALVWNRHPDLCWFNLQFFLTSQWCESNMHSVETILWILNLNLFLGWWSAVCDTILSHDAGQQQQVTAPSQPPNRQGKQPILNSMLSHQHFLSIMFWAYLR